MTCWGVYGASVRLMNVIVPSSSTFMTIFGCALDQRLPAGLRTEQFLCGECPFGDVLGHAHATDDLSRGGPNRGHADLVVPARPVGILATGLPLQRVAVQLEQRELGIGCLKKIEQRPAEHVTGLEIQVGQPLRRTRP